MFEQPKPRVAPVKLVTDDYFGAKVTDNYRYMENFNSEAVQHWVKAQADFTINVLKQLPGRDAFFNRMMELEAFVPAKVGCVLRLSNSKILYLICGAQDDVWKLYMQDGMNGNEILLVDPDKFRQETGKPHAINQFIPSWDGKYNKTLNKI